MPLFKTRLRVLRAEREWSQAKPAAQVGVKRQTISALENGRFHPNLRLTFKIARTFGKGSPKCLSTRIFEGLGCLARHPRTGIMT
jgi:putative transcriptional regulator